MDNARALLDSLMGNTRNAGKDDRKKKSKGDSFKNSSVCKFALVGFCPENEELFYNTKRDLGKCRGTHFEINRMELEAHPDYKTYKAMYQQELLRHLTLVLRRCDEWGAKEKRKNEEKQTETCEVVAREEIKKLNQEVSNLLAEAEDLATAGNMQASKDKVAEADELRAKTAEYASKSGQVLDVCAICGSSKESEFGIDGQFSHTIGKVHKGYVIIRKWYDELKEKEDRGELKFDPIIEEPDDRDSRRQERSRSARADRRANGQAEKEDRHSGRGGDRDRDRGGECDRDRGDRGGDRYRGRARRHEEDGADRYGDDRGSRRRREHDASPRRREDEGLDTDAFGRSTRRDRREDDYADRRRRPPSDEPKRRLPSEEPKRQNEPKHRPPSVEPPPPPSEKQRDPEEIEEWNRLAARIDAGGAEATRRIAAVFSVQAADVKAWRELWHTDRQRALDGPTAGLGA